MNASHHGRVFAMSAPAGTGKDTVIRQLKKRGNPLHFLVTYTTRAPRSDERNHVDYHFVSETEFDRLKADGYFLETAVYNGQQYGSPRQEVLDVLARGTDVLLKIEVQGVRAIRSKYPDAVTIFLMPPSLEVAAQRLGERNSESVREREQRLNIGAQELSASGEYDYRVVNAEGQLPQVVAEIEAIIRQESRTSSAVDGHQATL